MRVKKLLIFALCMVVIASISVVATLAYFTDNDSVTNTFTVGKVGIKLDEAKTDEYGVLDTTATSRVQENEYKAVPGHVYVKDPMVTVEADSEASFIRMLVTVNNIDVFKAGCPESDFADFGSGEVFKIENYVTGWNEAKWPCVSATYDADGKVCSYEFRYYQTVSTADAPEKELEPLFTHITMPGTLNNAQIAQLDDLEINVVAQAIQADGFGNDADAAWAAYATQVATNPNPAPNP